MWDAVRSYAPTWEEVAKLCHQHNRSAPHQAPDAVKEPEDDASSASSSSSSDSEDFEPASIEWFVQRLGRQMHILQSCSVAHRDDWYPGAVTSRLTQRMEIGVMA